MVRWLSAVVSRVEPTSCWLKPKLSCAKVSHIGTEGMLPRKRQGCYEWTGSSGRLINVQGSVMDTFCRGFCCCFFPLQNYWMLRLNQIQRRKMSRDLSVTNELLESPCACCLLVLNMKLWRDFNPFHKLLLPTPPPLPPHSHSTEQK